jgi:Rad3-related DNA helicase
MDETQILDRVRTLVEEEHALRKRHRKGELSDDEEQARLRELEESLDQCWDLLRQRRALKDAGENPDEAEARPVSQVEGYLQ